MRATRPRVLGHCARCRRPLKRNARDADDWNTVSDQGRLVGRVCPQCQTPEDHAETDINAATLDYASAWTTPDGRTAVTSKGGGHLVAACRHSSADQDPAVHLMLRRGPHPLRQDHGLRPLPLPPLRHQPGLAGAVPDRDRPARLDQNPAADQRVGHRRAQEAPLPRAARGRPDHTRSPPPAPADRRHLALAPRTDRRVPPPRRAAPTGHLTGDTVTGHPRPEDPGAPGHRAGTPACPPSGSSPVTPDAEITADQLPRTETGRLGPLPILPPKASSATEEHRGSGRRHGSTQQPHRNPGRGYRSQAGVRAEVQQQNRERTER